MSLPSYAIPFFAVLAWLEIGRMHRALADGGGVVIALAEIDAIRKHRPDLGILTEQADDLRREFETMARPEGRWSSSLTAAELRLLPLLATHLSFREIGERLFVTRNTVKTQAISVYRKLGVSSRSEAIQRAAELGLVDAAVVPVGSTPRSRPTRERSGGARIGARRPPAALAGPSRGAVKKLVREAIREERTPPDE